MTWIIITQPETRIPNQILEGNQTFSNKIAFLLKRKRKLLNATCLYLSHLQVALKAKNT